VQFIVATYPNKGGIETDGEAGRFVYHDLGGCVSHLFLLAAKGFVIYSMLEGSKLVDATNGDLWEAHYWNGRVSKYVFAGKVTILPLSGMEEFSAQAVWPYFQWLHDLGVTPGSLTGMAQKIWRRSLTQKVGFFDEGKNGRLALYGSRKEAIPGRYRDVRYQDLSAAFPTAMANNLFPRTIKESRRNQLYDIGYALATVRIPSGLSWYPIPCRLGKGRVTYGYGEQTDYWMHEDLHNVLTVGGSVKIHRSWRGFDMRGVFRNWWHEIMQPARNTLAGDSLLVCKSVANRLWSSFAVGGSSKTIRYQEEGTRKRVIDRSTDLRGMRYETYIAAQVTALVRTRVFDALNRFRDPIYVDTDGIICREMEDAGNGWRIKRRMRVVDVHSCQNYRWECYRCNILAEPYCGGPHYALAVPTKSRRAAEIILKQPAMPVNPLFGMTIKATETLGAMRERYGYEEPMHEDGKEWIWAAQGEGRQESLPV
jgi:hypothetical protein